MSDQITFPPGVDGATKKRTRKFFSATTDNENLVSLIKQGICLEARNSGGWTPLHIAAFYVSLDAVRSLIAACVDIDARAYDGKTALMIASAIQGSTAAGHSDKTDVMKALLTAGADIQAVDNNRCCVLHAASDSLWSTNALLEKGANIYPNDLISTILQRYKNHYITRYQKEYEDFTATHQPPASAEQTYRWLSCMVPAERFSTNPVNYTENIRRIFTHAKWQNKEQAAAILNEIRQDGMINTETTESILATTFPPERTAVIKRAGRGR